MPNLKAFEVQAFGCQIRVETSCVEAYEALQRYIFPPFPRTHDAATSADIAVQVEHVDGRFLLLANGAEISASESLINLAPALIRVVDDAVIRNLRSFRAVHAGTVLCGHQALLLPGATHAGKSSIVAELLRRGAKYFSDEYALIDPDGFVHAYPRPLLLRNGKPEQIPVLPEELNSSFGVGPVPIGWILSFEYQPSYLWDVEKIPQGEGLMLLLRNTPHALEDSPNMMDVFLKAVARAECFVGRRGDAEEAVDYIEKLVGGLA
jgi:hypothetical protein